MADERAHSSGLDRDERSLLKRNSGRREPVYLRPTIEIACEDISEISALQEGWFFEIKERAPENSKLAKSVSSFANSHGGLLVIGAKEDQKTRRLARYSPMTRDEADATIARVREAVTSHVSPPTFFDAKALEIEPVSSSIEHRWIVLVQIPKGRFGPYLHSSGCIYVRVGDAATPSALNDLTQQERLWAEALHRNERIKARIERLSAQLKQGTPAVHIAILADEDVTTDRSFASWSEFRKIALSAYGAGAEPVFDHVQTLDTSYVARRTEKKIDAASLVWDYDAQRRLHFLRIPIATHRWSGGKFDNEPSHFDLEELATSLRTRAAPDEILIANLLPSLFFLSVILRMVSRLHARASYAGTLRLNACVVDAKGTVPYFGTPMYFAEIKENGPPYVLREVGFFRSLDEPANWLPLTVPSDLPGLPKIDIENTFSVFTGIARSLGISPNLTVGFRDDEDVVNTGPLSEMFAEIFTGEFSFVSQQNPRK
jgi:Putative DNA-binding domain